MHNNITFKRRKEEARLVLVLGMLMQTGIYICWLITILWK